MQRWTLPAAAWARLYFCYWLHKLSTCRTCEWPVGAATTGKCLVLGAVGFVGMYKSGLGRARVGAAAVAPTVGPSAGLRQFQDLTSVDLWKQCLRDRANFWDIQDWDGAKGNANNRVFCEPARQATGDITGHNHQWADSVHLTPQLRAQKWI